MHGWPTPDPANSSAAATSADEMEGAGQPPPSSSVQRSDRFFAPIRFFGVGSGGGGGGVAATYPSCIAILGASHSAR
eukprot:5519944-Pleurochrysis_carterae.AAC.1